ncbi:DNA/RNA non-specific endonuclease [Actinomyces gerencseriae]|uniref:DNA/RNA non-specific endonuclease n=1 Tax=Actinomyces gerencseriae TaxID=52769 RepID=UPI001FDEE624|nr:DNA/RNA non-specific endonuclease [Actinomyces gerencseriae]
MPDTTYTVDEKFHYTTDDQARTIRCQVDSMDPIPAADRMRDPAIQKEVARYGSSLDGTYEGGHLVGTQFGGPPERLNMVLHLDGVNRGVGGPYSNSVHSFEMDAARNPGKYTDIDSLALGRRTALRTTLTLTDSTTHHDIDPPDQVTSAITAITTELRDPQTQAKPHAGAWTREQISMETDDLKLVTILRMGPRPRLHRHRLRRRTPPPPPQPPAHPHLARPRRRTRPPPTQQTNHPLNTPNPAEGVLFMGLLRLF